MRIHQAVAQKLGSEILEGKYPPESLFPGEIEHSAFLNVSRTPYREAIRTLVAKGLLLVLAVAIGQWRMAMSERNQARLAASGGM